MTPQEGADLQLRGLAESQSHNSNKHNILFIGLDTHKDFVEVAYIEDQRGAQAVHFGRISSAKTAIVKLAKQLQSKYSQATLHFVYEAGPCGYWIYRLLTGLGHCCYVVVPSLIPKKPGIRLKPISLMHSNLPSC